MKNMKIYISGPISSNPHAREHFAAAEHTLTSWGYEVINPFNNGLTDAHSWNDHMIEDIRLLLTAEAICMLPGWERSPGAKIEHAVAKNKLLPIYSLHERILIDGLSNTEKHLFFRAYAAMLEYGKGYDPLNRTNNTKGDVLHTILLATWMREQNLPYSIISYTLGYEFDQVISRHIKRGKQCPTTQAHYKSFKRLIKQY